MGGGVVSLDVNGEHAGVVGRLHVLGKAAGNFQTPPFLTPHLTSHGLRITLGTSTRYFRVPGTEYTKVLRHQHSGPLRRPAAVHSGTCGPRAYCRFPHNRPRCRLETCFRLSFFPSGVRNGFLTDSLPRPCRARTHERRKWEKTRRGGSVFTAFENVRGQTMNNVCKMV